MQMQSGTTGINTLRIYSPARQAAEHDPEGVFIRRWLPEFGTSAYPAPVVDEKHALKHAKDTMYGLRQRPEARAEANEVQERHGSRKSGLAASAGRPGTRGGQRRATAAADEASPQLDLFS
jgi:deoxyribodipyrimidine photo-lyase